jgi:hypothetical protein
MKYAAQECSICVKVKMVSWLINPSNMPYILNSDILCDVHNQVLAEKRRLSKCAEPMKNVTKDLSTESFESVNKKGVTMTRTLKKAFRDWVRNSFINETEDIISGFMNEK